MRRLSHALVLGGAARPVAARAPALAADRLRALGAEALRDRGLGLVAEREVGAEQALERRRLREIGRRLEHARALLRDALEQLVVLVGRALLLDLPAHRFRRQRVGALHV